MQQGNGQPHNDSGGSQKRSSDATETFPHARLCIRKGELLRKSIDTRGVCWEPKALALTADKLLIGRIGDATRRVNDYIALHAVVSIEVQEEEVEAQSLNTGARSEQFLTPPPQDKGSDIDFSKQMEVVIRTSELGHNMGRSYAFRGVFKEATSWADDITQAVKACKAAHHKKWRAESFPSWLALKRYQTREAYDSLWFQYAVAVMICTGFVIDVIEAQLMPAEGSSGEQIFFTIDVLLSSAFTIELIINLFANSSECFKAFFAENRNIFDALIVLISLVSLVLGAMGIQSLPAVKMLRLIRVVRVVRLFKNFYSLNRIVLAIGECIVPMFNAFFILFIVTSMYATLGTHLFGKSKPDFFGNFATSLFSMIQVASGDSWASSIGRSLFDVDDSGVARTDHAVTFFFVSYFLIGGLMLLNVVVAVLLDEFIASVAKEKEEMQRAHEEEAAKKRVIGVLDPITSQLTNFDDAEDLTERIDAMYAALDAGRVMLLVACCDAPGVHRCHARGARRRPRDALACVL